MTRLRVLVARALGLIGLRWRDADLYDEIEAHLDLLTAAALRTGLSPKQARAAARRQLGSLQHLSELYRDQRSLPHIDAFIQDARYAVRTFVKNPTFSVAAILTLAVGSTTAIFNIVDGVILRPLSYPQANRLAAVNEWTPRFGAIPVNGLHFQTWRRNAQSFDAMALIGSAGLGFSNLTGDGEPERIPMARVSPSLFAMLGVHPAVGRTLIEEDDQEGRDHVIVISDRLWTRRFAADPKIVGQSLMLDGVSYEVVGVLPDGFRFPKLQHLYAIDIAGDHPEVWKPIGLTTQELTPGNFNLICLARLKPGVSTEAAAGELNSLEHGWALVNQSSETAALRTIVLPLQAQIVDRTKAAMELMFAAVSVVLLIGCLNVANLWLARVSSRRREFDIRVAIGASRGRLVRQMLVEGIALGLIGGALGVAIAYGSIQAILAFEPADIPRLDEIRIDWRLLAFAASASALSGVFVGLVPAWRFTTRSATPAAAGGLRAMGSRGGHVRSVVVVVEVALSAACLISAGLLLHSFVNVLSVDRGFKTEHILTVDFTFSPTRYATTAQRAAFIRVALDRLHALPGVESIGISNVLPLAGDGGNSAMFVEGAAAVDVFSRPIASVRYANPDYFRTFGIALRSGRLFAEADQHRHVAVLSASMAARAWPGQDPIGRTFRFSRGTGPLTEVLGIVSDVRGIALDREPAMTVYLPYWQDSPPTAAIAVKAATDPAMLSSSIRAVFRALDADLPLSAFRMMDDVASGSVSQRRFQTVIVLLFAAASILLAALGVYGVMAYGTVQRTNEMGIRLALGAEPAAVRRMVLASALRLVGGGLGIGLLIASGAGLALRSLLFGVGSFDPIAIVGTCLAVTAAGLVAAYIPARRASLIDPVAALRCD